jgi:hypothetical protein
VITAENDAFTLLQIKHRHRASAPDDRNSATNGCAIWRIQFMPWHRGTSNHRNG